MSETFPEFKYAISLRPIVAAGGIQGLDEGRRSIFHGLLTFVSSLIKSAEEVSSAEITDDYTIIVIAKSEIEESLRKIGQNTIITRL